MDGRWKLCLAGGLLAGALGCNTTPKQPLPLDPAGQQQAAAKQPTVTTPAQLAKAAPPPPATPPRTHLKPETYVTMGALKEQAAEEGDRPQAERDAYRYQARQSYQDALKVDPKFAPAYVALAKSYAATDEKDKSQAMFAKAVALKPNDGNLWYEMGAAQARAKDFPAAVQSLTKATQLDPDNKAAQKLLGFTLARGGWYEPALNALAKCMPEAEARYNVGRMMQHNGQAEAAAVQLQLALRADPSFEPARALLSGGGAAADTGVRQAGYQASPEQPAAPRVPPVMLGGGAPAPGEPTPVGVAGRSE
jgi:tetratricopeptide (TPR) repeat protein